MRDSVQNVSLHKESIQNHTRLKQYVLIQFRNVHDEFTNISYFGVYTSELVIEKATYHDNRVFLLSQK